MYQDFFLHSLTPGEASVCSQRLPLSKLRPPVSQKQNKNNKGLYHVNVDYLPCNASGTDELAITDDRELASGLGDAQRAVTFVRMTKVRSPIEVRGCPPLLDVGRSRSGSLSTCLQPMACCLLSCVSLLDFVEPSRVMGPVPESL